MNNAFEQLAKQITDRVSSLLPGDSGPLQKDIENTVHGLLQSTFSKMNLVSREEFDIQAAVLQRTREKLEQLEKRLETLHKTPANKV